MKIKKITLNNIRSYKHAELEFPAGSVVLSGDIGSGKTSILLAIEFALFGLQPGQRGSSLLRNGTDEGSVALEIEIDGKDMTIERGLKRGKKTVSQSYAKLRTENENKEMAVTELKTRVLQILNYPKEFAKKTNILYRFTVYTPQEEMKQIILESSDARLNTLRHIFGIDKYKRIRENTETFTIKLREQIRAYEGEIKNFEEIKKNLEEKKKIVDSIEKNLQKTKQELELRKQEKQKAEKELKGVE
ncbi:MAG: SMC family ATPase, partial [Candidatus Thorarchaeota archaeon]